MTTLFPKKIKCIIEGYLAILPLYGFHEPTDPLFPSCNTQCFPHYTLDSEGEVILTRQPIAQNGFSQRFSTIAERMKEDETFNPSLPRLVWRGLHILRHSFVQNMHLQGLPLQVISDQLGHSSIETLRKHYLRHLDIKTRQALFQERGW